MRIIDIEAADTIRFDISLSKRYIAIFDIHHHHHHTEHSSTAMQAKSFKTYRSVTTFNCPSTDTFFRVIFVRLRFNLFYVLQNSLNLLHKLFTSPVTTRSFSIAVSRAWNALPSDIKLISSRSLPASARNSRHTSSVFYSRNFLLVLALLC